jgi:hypothetical protein
MADGVAVTAGSGTTILTDDTGATGHAQVIKLAISTDGSPTLIPADSGNGLDVDVTRLPAPLTTTGTGTEAAALRVTIATDSTGVLSVDDNGGSLTVDGTVTASLAAGTNNIGDVDILSVPAPLSTTGNGTAATALRVTVASDSTGALSVSGTVTANLAAGTNNIGDVDVLTLPALPAGTNNIGDVDIASIAAGDNNIGNVDIVTMPNVTLAAGTNTNEVVGDVAHDSPAAGNPLLMGGYASAAAPTDVSLDADAVRAWFLRNGAQAVQVTAAGTLVAAGNGTAATALRVTVASDSTGVLAVGDNGGSLTVDNTVLSVVGGGTEATAQRVTIASDSTGVLSVDDNGASLTIDNAALSVVGNGAAATALRVTLANDSTGTTAVTNAGTFAVQAALTAGTNTNEVVGDVAHDAPAAGNPLLVGGFASAAAPTAVSTDGDMVRAWHLLNGAQATVLTAAGALIGGDATNGLDVDVTRLPAPLTTTGTGTEATALRVTIATDSTGVLSVDDNGASLTVDNSTLAVVGGGTEATAMRVTIASDSTGVLSIDDNGGTLTVDNAALSVVGNGAAATALRVSLANDSTGIVALTTSTASIGKLAANSGIDIGDVDVTSIIPGTGATNLGKAIDSIGGATDTGVAVLAIRDDALTTLTPVDGDYVALRTDATGQLWVNPQGNVAHDIADAGNPIKLGLKAKTSPKGLTLVADNDRTDAYADLDGIQITKIGTSNSDLISERVADTGGTSTAFTNFSAVASTRNYVTAIAVFNTSAAACSVDFRDGTGGTVLWTMYCPAGGGSVITSAIPLFKTTAATALAYDVSGAITTCIINVSGFQSKA